MKGWKVSKVVWYQHHGQVVAVDEGLKGKHREMCLCHRGCVNFKPGTAENCDRAEQNYRACRLNGMVMPVFECPEYLVAGDGTV